MINCGGVLEVLARMALMKVLWSVSLTPLIYVNALMIIYISHRSCNL